MITLAKKKFSRKMLFLKKHLLMYKRTTQDLFFNFWKFDKSSTYKNGLKAKNVLIYSFSSFVMFSIIVLLPLNILSTITGSIGLWIFFVKTILFDFLVAFFYAIPIYFLKKEFLWQKISLILILVFSFYFPFYSLSSLPMLLNQQNLHINFFLGGDPNLEFNPISRNLYLLWFTVVVQEIHMIIPTFLIPTIWLSKALNIKWWIMLLIIVFFSIIPVEFIKYINPKILDFTHYINNIVGSIP